MAAAAFAPQTSVFPHACTFYLPTPRPPGPQLEDAALQAFLLRAPSVLRLADGKLAAQMEWLQEAAGVGRAHVVRAYRSWPQLATTSIAVLQDRCAARVRLLQGWLVVHAEHIRSSHQ